MFDTEQYTPSISLLLWRVVVGLMHMGISSAMLSSVVVYISQLYHHVVGGIFVNGNAIVLQESGSTYVIDVPSNGAWLNLDVSFEDEPACSYYLGNAFYGPSDCYVNPECFTDLSDDGATTVQDLLLVLSEFGCGFSCQHDVNEDGNVTVDDLLLILGAFGSSCI